jgi:hypothetical protein
MSTVARFAGVVSASAAVALAFATAATAQPANSIVPFNGDRYAPVLAVDNDPICAEALKDIRAHFLAPKPWQTYPALNILFSSLAPADDLAEEPGTPPLNRVVVVDGKKLFVSIKTYPGCGGACEAYGFQVSDSPIPYNGKTMATTGSGMGWSVYKDKTGRHFTIGIEQRKKLHLYRISSDKGLELSCTAELIPNRTVLDRDDDWSAAFASTRLLKQARDRIAGGEGGMCGSMQTRSRWSSYVDEALAEALYRPWALVEMSQAQFKAINPRGYLGANSGGDYTRILFNLEDWSLAGLSEYRAMSAYRDQLAATVDAVARFYRLAFHWPPMDLDLRALAAHTLTTAISRGFGFYLYEPVASDSERRLRRAILEHRPIAEIEAIRADPRTMGRERGESPLNIAVTYPAALLHLLGQGANPNQANAFGKTPLMYAAQYNQEEAAAILLRAGANPNAATVWPEDNCYYALQTASMTPLHYAVRYASADLVRALLNHGARPEIKTEKRPYNGDGEYPIDWLRKYTTPGAKEPNANMSASDLPALEALLSVKRP